MSQFDENDPAVLHAVIRANPLATLVTAGEGGLAAVHVPLVIDPSKGAHGMLRGHVARANALARQDGATALAIFHGPQAYVTPSWYPSKAVHGKVVPTWNYVVAHANVTLRLVDDPAWIRAQMEELTHQQESRRARPWMPSDAPADYLEKMVSMVIGIEMPIARLTGRRKASQNRDALDRRGVVEGLAREGKDPALVVGQPS